MGKQFANRDVSNLVIKDFKTGEIFAFIDYANVTAVDMTGETVYAYGGQGHPRKVTFSGDRGGTLRVESQITDGTLYSMLTGAEVENTASYIRREELSGDAITAENTFVLPTAAVNTTGITVFKKADDLEKPLDGTYSFSGSDETHKTIVFTAAADSSDSIATTDEIVVYYSETIEDVVKLNLTSTTFPKAVKIYGETWDKDENDNIIAEHMVAYKAVPQPAFTISNQNTGDPGTITITYDLLEDSNKDIFDLIFVDEN